MVFIFVFFWHARKEASSRQATISHHNWTFVVLFRTQPLTSSAWEVDLTKKTPNRTNVSLKPDPGNSLWRNSWRSDLGEPLFILPIASPSRRRSGRSCWTPSLWRKILSAARARISAWAGDRWAPCEVHMSPCVARHGTARRSAPQHSTVHIYIYIYIYVYIYVHVLCYTHII